MGGFAQMFKVCSRPLPFFCLLGFDFEKTLIDEDGLLQVKLPPEDLNGF